MKKNYYNSPLTEITSIDPEEMMQAIPGASQFDNDGDGNNDQEDPIIGDPIEIGSKQGFFDDDDDSQLPGYNPWN